MTIGKNGSDAVALIRPRILGKKVESFACFGINSMKTFEPAPDSLAGQAIESVDADADGRLRVTFQDSSLVVDFARTGRAVLIENAEPWTLRGNATRPPTGRLLLADGLAVDFAEPAKTKRIAFSIHLRESKS